MIALASPDIYCSIKSNLYKVIENLVLSLNQPNAEIDKLWIEESTKRVEAMKNGSLKTVSYGDVFAS